MTDHTVEELAATCDASAHIAYIVMIDGEIKHVFTDPNEAQFSQFCHRDKGATIKLATLNPHHVGRAPKQAPPPSTVRDGWALVPKEPTPEMLAAWWRQKNTGSQEPCVTNPHETHDAACYRAMLSASPPVPETRGAQPSFDDVKRTELFVIISRLFTDLPDDDDVAKVVNEIEALLAAPNTKSPGRKTAEYAELLLRLDRWGQDSRGDGKHHTLREAAAAIRELLPYKVELHKIAAELGEPDDPFAAWEAVAALSSPASPIPGETGWRDIASAPKDGTQVLVYRPIGIPITCVAAYGSGSWWTWPGDLPVAPSHWHQLPTPPFPPQGQANLDTAKHTTPTGPRE